MNRTYAQLFICLLIAFGTLLTSSCDKEDISTNDTNNNTEYNDNYNYTGDNNGDNLGENNDHKDGDCPQTIDYNDYTYQIINIGEQCWFAENLRYLPEVFPPTNGSGTLNRYYVYAFNFTSVEDAKASEFYQNYGVLYNWTAALTACPPGWKLPSDADWIELTDYLGGHLIAGGKLKQSGTDFWNTPNTDATNESGFNALPGGQRGSTGFFNSVTNIGYWWSSTEFSSNNSWGRIMQYNTASAGKDAYSKRIGLSVRCIIADDTPTGI